MDLKHGTNLQISDIFLSLHIFTLIWARKLNGLSVDYSKCLDS